MKRTCLLSYLLFLVTVTQTYALTPEEILLLKKAGVSDEKILEMQKKEGASTASVPIAKINPFDWNEDGKKDIISGSDSGRVYVYINKGANQEPIFDNATEINGAEIMRFSKPSVVDWNNDGKKDILVGARSGEVSVFINMGANQSPLFAAEMKLNGGDLDVGSSSSPAVVDWNGDGKKDLVVGNQSGKVFVFLNIGQDNAPLYASNGLKTNIEVDGYATPFISDWNNDGKFDVLCGSSDGRVYIFINEGDSKTPRFGKPQALHINDVEFKLPSRTSVIALDWDDDGKTDLLVSNIKVEGEGKGKGKGKGMHFAQGPKNNAPLRILLFLNKDTKEKPEFREPKRIKGNFRDDTAL